MAISIGIWPGSASFFPGDTPYGIFDDDVYFQEDAEKTAVWCAQRLGYPVVDVELQDVHFFSAFEEAVAEYGNQINTFSARDNLINLLGFPTGSLNYSGRYIEPSLRGVFRLAKQYGSEVAAGGTLTYYTGSIAIQENQQVYDFTNTAQVTLETGSFATDAFTIRKIFHEEPASTVRFLDPTADLTGVGSQALLDQFGWGGMGTPNTFMAMPLFYDALRIQAIEMHGQIRKSAYSFQLTNNRLRVFPIPTQDFTMYFTYTLDSQNIPTTAGSANDRNTQGKITGHSNVPYFHVTYQHVNDMGKQWIRKYTLAIAKEMLGRVRGKYSEIPIPGQPVTVNGSELISEAQSEKEALITEIKETLDQFSRQAQLERKQAEAEALQNQINKVPLKFYVR
jgi:hypothetical protein